MKTHRFLVSALLLGVLLAAAPAGAATAAPAGPAAWPEPDQQTEKFSRTVPLPKNGTFDLSNIAGDIVITGGAGDQVIIEAVKRGRTADDLKAVQIEVNTAAGRVEVQTRYPESRHNVSVSVDFTVTVPKTAAINVRSVSGDLKASGIDGQLRADTVSGTVTLSSVTQLGSAKSVSGDVSVDTVTSAGDLSASSISGSVILRAVKARTLDANSVSGDVKLDDVTCERLTVKSISGDITFAGPLAKGGRYELQSHSGDLTLYLNDTVGFEVTASSFSGDITSDLPLTMKFGGGAAPQDRRHRQEVRGTFGDGSAVLQVSAFSGDVRIVKK